MCVETDLGSTVNSEMCCQLENDYVLTLKEVMETNSFMVCLCYCIMN